MAVSSDVDKSLRENPAFRKYAYAEAQKRLGYPPRSREIEAEKARLVEELGTIITKPSLSPSEDNQLKSIFGEDYDFSFLRKEGTRPITNTPKDALSRASILSGRMPNQSTASAPPETTGQQGTAGAGSGSLGRSLTPAGTSTALDSSGNVVSTAPKLAFDNKGKLVSTKPLMVGSMESSPATSRSDSRKSALDRARDILKGDTYQLGSSSILTAAREMRKPTPFKQRTDEQVAARNLVVRDRMAREQQQNKATALNRAKSRMRDVATAQKGAQQFFADTGVSPRQVRALSGERMPERRRTYEAPKEPPSLKSMIEEQRELDKRRRNR
jgi:arylsulfatase A-like enzyme